MPNPQDPAATYAIKGEGQKKKEHVGYKVQEAETVTHAELELERKTREKMVATGGGRVT